MLLFYVYILSCHWHGVQTVISLPCTMTKLSYLTLSCQKDIWCKRHGYKNLLKTAIHPTLLKSSTNPVKKNNTFNSWTIWLTHTHTHNIGAKRDICLFKLLTLCPEVSWHKHHCNSNAELTVYFTVSCSVIIFNRPWSLVKLHNYNNSYSSVHLSIVSSAFTDSFQSKRDLKLTTEPWL